MTYTQAKAKILAARAITETSPFKLERGYVYASFYSLMQDLSIKGIEGFGIFSIRNVPANYNENHIWAIDYKSRLVRI